MALPIIKIVVLSTNLFSIKVYVNFIYKVLQVYTKTTSISVFPTKKTVVTLLKSPHVYKKSKEQYQLKKYRVVVLSSVCVYNKNLFKFFLLNKPKSVVLSFVLER